MFKDKINPALKFLSEKVEIPRIVAIVPVQMTESWMLANKELLKSEIGVDKSYKDLGISKAPEEYNDPKSVIQNVIRISKEGQTKRKRSRGLEISDLYQIIGQKLDLSDLEKLPSFCKFRDSLREVLKELNYLHA
ncbi:MAG: hypothetical protein ACOVRN_07065 [Flavobacterium sp.]